MNTPADPSAPRPLIDRLVDSGLPYGLPDFARVREEEIEPAIRAGIDRHDREIARIIADPAPATFENTIVALERSGRALGRATALLYTLVSAASTPGLLALEERLAPVLAAHDDAVLLDERLFARVDAVHRSLAGDSTNASTRAAPDTSTAPATPAGLDPESRRLVEHTHRDFIRAGAALDAAGRARLREIDAELATLSSRFGTRLLDDTNALAVRFAHPEELAGLTPAEIAGLGDPEHGCTVRLPLPNGHPWLARLRVRRTRERILRASLARGAHGGEHDTRAIALRMARLRAERAELLGWPDHATLVLADEDAGSPEAVEALLARVTPAAVRRARAEADELQRLADVGGLGDEEPADEVTTDDAPDEDEKPRAETTPEDGGSGGTTASAPAPADAPSPAIAAWDWAWLAARRHDACVDVDPEALREHFEFDRVLRDWVFRTARLLYGVRVVPRPDLAGWHPDVRVFETSRTDASGHTRPLGLVLIDPFVRPEKQGGAWMDTLVEQSRLFDEHAVVTMVLDIQPPAPGEPALLTLDDVRTVFHEFGHALHALLSDVTYPRFAGTNVPRDFVEMPSQFNETWALHPQVLPHYARSVRTGAPLPEAVADRLRAAERLDQGFRAVEYLEACAIDLAWHRLSRADTDALVEEAGRTSAAQVVDAVEQRALAPLGLVGDAGAADLAALIPPRYRTATFQHAFAGGYAAGYASYLWSEVIDADIEAWFAAHGGLDRAAGERFARMLSRGGAEEPRRLVVDLLGRQPDPHALLVRRGFASDPEDATGA